MDDTLLRSVSQLDLSENKSYRVICGDALEKLRELPSETVNACVTSPVYYGLRDYGVSNQIGLEDTPEEYIEKLINMFREVKRVLRSDGSLWVNIGDCYTSGGRSYRAKDPKNSARAMSTCARTPAEMKSKDLIGIPWMLAFALRADGWYLRQDIIWHKPNCMPESVRDRCTRSHEYIFLLTKSLRYYFDADAIREPNKTAERQGPRRSYRLGTASSYSVDGGHISQSGSFAGLPLNPKGKNKRDVWTICTGGFKGAHFAVFPEKLAEPCILAGCPEGGVVMDPFMGSGTTGVVAKRLRRRFIGIDINAEYVNMASERIEKASVQYEQMTIQG